MLIKRLTSSKINELNNQFTIFGETFFFLINHFVKQSNGHLC